MCVQWICAEPIIISGLTSYILNQLQSVSDSSDTEPPCRESSLQPLPSQRLGALQLLPTEIISRISSFLPTLAIIHLRQSSKILASKISINQSFWRHSLVSSDLVDYLWDLDLRECHQKDKAGSWDWKALAQKLKKAEVFKPALVASLASSENDEITVALGRLTLGETESEIDLRDAPIGLQNRCRIIRIVKDVEKLDKIEAEEPVVDGEKQRHVGLLFA